MKHLNNKTEEFVLNSSVEERIIAAKQFKWIGYTKAIKAINKMEDLYAHPKVDRMPNLLIVGDSNNGKTALLNRFSKRYPAVLDDDTKSLSNPVVMIQAPPEPDEKRFYNSILESLYAPVLTSEKIDSRQRRVISIFKSLNVQILIIDEIQHVLAGSPRKQRLFLNVIKYLSNELKIPIICSGIKDAFNVMQSDQQLSNRFEPIVLTRWSNDIEYKRLLLSFEKLLPLKKESHLIEGSTATKILAMSDGLIGEISKILQLSTVLAIESGSERITKSIINEIDFIPPQNRKKPMYL